MSVVRASAASLLALTACFHSSAAWSQEMMTKQQLDEARARAQQEIMMEDMRECKPYSMSTCWYMFFAASDAPVRRVWFLDLKVRTPQKGVAEIDVIEAHESDDKNIDGANDFVFYTIQYRCAQKKMRVLDGYAFMFGNRVDRAPGAGEWLGDYEGSWFGDAGKVACSKAIQLTPASAKLLWMGDYYRPIDLVDFTRRYLWEQGR
jgi:hypothetical protein